MSRTTAGPVALGVVVAMASLVGPMPGAGAAPSDWWHQDFSEHTEGWDPGRGSITLDDGTAVVSDSFSLGPVSEFDRQREEWPGDWFAELKVLLDPSWPVGSGFGYSVSTFAAEFFTLIVGVDGSGLWVGATPNFEILTLPNRPADAATIAVAGWYTIRHVVRDVDGVLTVTVSLVAASGTEVFSRTFAGTELSGNGLALFSPLRIPGGLRIDDHRLGAYLAPPPPPPPSSGPRSKGDCTREGWRQFGFKNQGQCVSSLVSAGAART